MRLNRIRILKTLTLVVGQPQFAIFRCLAQKTKACVPPRGQMPAPAPAPRTNPPADTGLPRGQMRTGAKRTARCHPPASPAADKRTCPPARGQTLCPPLPALSCVSVGRFALHQPAPVSSSRHQPAPVNSLPTFRSSSTCPGQLITPSTCPGQLTSKTDASRCAVHSSLAARRHSTASCLRRRRALGELGAP